MKAIVLKSFGGPESFELCDAQARAAGGAGAGAGACHVDQSAGLPGPARRYPDLVPLPTITGHDVSGVIEAVGGGDGLRAGR